MNTTRSLHPRAVAVFLISALLALSACARPDAYVEVDIRNVDRYQAAVQWVNAQSDMPAGIGGSAPSCVEVAEEIVPIYFATFVYSVAIEDFDTEGFGGDYDRARLNPVHDSLAAIDQRRQVDTLDTASYRAPRLDGLGNPSCPYMMFFSTPYENMLLAEVLGKQRSRPNSYRGLTWYAEGYAYMFMFNDQGEIDDVRIGAIFYE